jgi:hypothetical protein
VKDPTEVAVVVVVEVVVVYAMDRTIIKKTQRTQITPLPQVTTSTNGAQATTAKEVTLPIVVVEKAVVVEVVVVSEVGTTTIGRKLDLFNNTSLEATKRLLT